VVRRHDLLAGVSGVEGDPAIPRAAHSQPRPTSPGPYGSITSAGFDKLGWHWWPMPAAIISEDYDGRPAATTVGTANPAARAAR
jgi:hypothetical protein